MSKVLLVKCEEAVYRIIIIIIMNTNIAHSISVGLEEIREEWKNIAAETKNAYLIEKLNKKV